MASRRKKTAVKLPSAPLVVTVQASHEEDPIWIETWSSGSGSIWVQKFQKRLGAILESYYIICLYPNKNMPYFRDNDNQPCGFADPHPQRLFLAALARHERSADLACLKQFRAETPHFSTGHLERLPGLLPVQALVFGRLRRSLESGGFGFNVSNKSKFRGFFGSQIGLNSSTKRMPWISMDPGTGM